jgi:hypothetical protein
MAMYIGDLYMRMHTTTPATYYSPTFERGGLSATFAIDVFKLFGTSVTLECLVEHKNHEDTSYTTAGTFSSMNSETLWKLDVSGLKEQIRLVITVGGTVATNTVFANVLPPMWRPY